MTDEVLYDLGVDLHHDFVFEDGDIKLIKYDDNLIQAIVNRLNTDLDELDLFYYEYGSILRTYMGWQVIDETISFIESEIETVLRSEPRLIRWEYEVGYSGDGVINAHLVLYPDPDYSIEATLSIDENGVEVVEDGT